MKITPLKFTREIPAILWYGYMVCTVCQNPILYLNPCYPFWKHRGYHRTRAEPYSCSALFQAKWGWNITMCVQWMEQCE